jgi:hypothetical protein
MGTIIVINLSYTQGIMLNVLGISFPGKPIRRGRNGWI